MRHFIWGVPIDAVSPDEAVDRVCALAGSGRHALVTTPNPEILYRSRSHPGLFQVLSGADLALPDGVGVVFALRALAGARTARVTGVDLVYSLLTATDERLSFYFLGAKPDVVSAAAQRASSFGADIRGYHHGYFSDASDHMIIDEIKDSGATVLLAGMGSPRQELWLGRHRGRLGGLCAITVGGTFDLLAGKTQRAPRWCQKIGLEWLYRAVREPTRWRRLAALPAFSALVAGGWVLRKVRMGERGGRD